MREAAMTSTGSPSLAGRLRRSSRALVRGAAAAFERTPLEVLLGACAAIGLSTAVEWQVPQSWTPLLVGVGTALPLVYAASALHARFVVNGWVRWGISAAALLACEAYAYLLFDGDLEGEVWRAWLLAGAAYGVLLCVPLIGPASGHRRAAAYAHVARLATRIAIVGAYAGALWVGLALALAAINGLFELHLPGRAWVHLSSVLFVLLPPWAVAAGLPALVAPPGAWREPELLVLRRIGAFLLAPLVYVYLAIVYAYTVRVLVMGEVPKNLVSPVVIGAGVLIVATSFTLEPAHGDERASGLSFLVRLAGPLLLPLVLFALWAVNTRVGQYGWTEFRFLRLLALVLLAAYGAAALWRLVRRRRPPLASLPAVLAIVLFLAAVGPLSAPAVARRSQAGALRALLAESGRRSGGAALTPVATATYRGITDKSAYLQGHFGWSALSAVVPWIGARPAGRLRTEEYAARIGISERVASGLRRVVSARLAAAGGIPGILGGVLFVFDTRGGSGGPRRPGRGDVAPAAPRGPEAPQLRVRVDATPDRLVVVPPGGGRLTVDLAPLLRALLALTTTQPGRGIFEGGGDRPVTETGRALDVELPPTQAVLPVVGADGRAAGQLVLQHLDFEMPAANAAAAPGHGGPAPAAGRPPAPGPTTPRITAASGLVLLTPVAGPRAP